MQNNQETSNVFKTSAILALIYCLMFNGFLLHKNFELYKVNLLTATLEIAKNSIYIYLATFITICGLSWNRLLFYIGSVSLFFSGAIVSYFVCRYNLVITKSLVFTFLFAPTEEFASHTDIWLITWCTLSVFMCASMLHSRKYRPLTNLQKIFAILCLGLSIFQTSQVKFKIIYNHYPYRYLTATYQAIEEIFSTKPKRLDISKQYSFIDNSDKDLIAVLVIGESSRGDKYGVNDYERDTTPLLSQQKKLWSYEAKACDILTYDSVPCIITRATQADHSKSLQESSFISIFDKMGFLTSWIGTQSLMKYVRSNYSEVFYDEAQTVMIPGGSALYKMNDHDEILLPYFNKLLSPKDSAKKMMVVHLSGSHWRFDERYPEAFRKFRPTCSDGKINKSLSPQDCSLESLKNSYDNSTLYTDYVVNEVIESLKDKNAFMIYTSDHAESLGEEGRFSHGNPDAPEQYDVPFMFWGSDKYLQAHPDVVSSLQRLKGKTLSHDNIFHSILDCAGIESEIIDKNLSICHKRIK